MNRIMKNLIIYSVVMTISSSLLLAQQEPNNAITLEALPKAVKGFPLVFKVTIQGKQEVSSLSIIDNDNPVTIHFKSDSDINEYTIKSFRIDYGVATIQSKHKLLIPEAQKCTMMFDAWALYVGNGKQTSLYDIPPGKYSVFVELKTINPTLQIWNRLSADQKREIEESGWKDYIPVFEPTMSSNTIALELIEPSEQETQFIKKMRKNSGEVYRDGVNWSAFLRRNIQIPGDNMSTLTDVSREQISFHKLISEVNIADEQSLVKSIDEVKNATLPGFFEPERQLLLLELKGNPAKERDNFLKKYPELKWRVEQLDSGKSIFSIGAQTSYETSPRRERHKIIQPPSEINNNSNPRNDMPDSRRE